MVALVGLSLTSAKGGIMGARASILVAFFAAELAEASDYTITFEEDVTPPPVLTSQYCIAGANNVGVRFLTGIRIEDDPVGSPSSGSHVATNNTGAEFDEVGGVVISFTTGQSHVGMKLGLKESYSALFWARLRAYASSADSLTDIDPDEEPIAETSLLSVYLGSEPTDIDIPIEVQRPTSDIRRVTLEFFNPLAEGEGGILVAAWETFDDLSFSDLGPACLTDSFDPAVHVWVPASGEGCDFGSFDAGDPGATCDADLDELLGLNTSAIPICIWSNDSGSGIAAVEMSIVIESAYGVLLAEQGPAFVCGSGFGESASCGVPPTVIPECKTFQFITHLDVEPEWIVVSSTIHVTASDYAGNTNEDETTISVALPGPDANLWAQAMEITQGTQPNLVVNETRRSEFSSVEGIPNFGFPLTTYQDAPLVAGRSTVVRLFAGLEDSPVAPAVGINAYLSCAESCSTTSDFVGLPCDPPSISPVNQGVDVSPYDSIDVQRLDNDKTWNFVLPKSWTEAGSVCLTGHVVGGGEAECDDGCTDAANYIRVGPVPFAGVPPFDDAVRIDVIRWRDSETAPWQAPSACEIQMLTHSFRKLWPVPEATVPSAAYATIDYYGDPAEATAGSCSDGFPGAIPPRADDGITFGFAKRRLAGLGGALGVGCESTREAWAAPGIPGGLHIASQELGHAFGLHHASPHCATGDTDCDADWPYPHGTIGAFGYDVIGCFPGAGSSCPGGCWEDGLDRADPVKPDYRGECTTPGCEPDDGIDNDGDGLTDEEVADGLDSPTLSICYPNECDCSNDACWSDAETDTAVDEDTFADPHDFMNYGYRALGDLSWVSPQTWRRLFNGLREMDFPNAIDPDALWVRGVMAGGVATLRPLFVVGSAVPPVLSESGAVRFQFLDEGGTLLAEHHADPGVPIVDPPSSASAAAGFSFLAPTVPGARRLIVTEAGATLLDLAASPNAPQVTLLTPDGGEVLVGDEADILWEASDADGDTLSYLVEYSPDGGANWRTVAVDVPVPEAVVPLSSLPGSSMALFRVVASDGFNTTIDLSNATFTVPDKPPIAEILGPTPRGPVKEGDLVVLRGLGSDVEDRILPDGALAWLSDRDGFLGSGRQMFESGLSPGLHRIYLTATDNAGQATTAGSCIRVLRRPNSQPVAVAQADVASPVTGQHVALDGSASFDPDGDDLVLIAWSLIERPVGSIATLDETQGSASGLTPDNAGTYRVRLLVHDGHVGSFPSDVVINAGGEHFDLCHGGTVCHPAYGCGVAPPVLDCALPAKGCLQGYCDPHAGCRAAKKPDGATCDDGHAMTSNDRCKAGVCRGHSPAPERICDDGFDDDGDGAADCHDADCRLASTCKRPGTYSLGHRTFSVQSTAWSGTVTFDAATDRLVLRSDHAPPALGPAEMHMVADLTHVYDRDAIVQAAVANPSSVLLSPDEVARVMRAAVATPGALREVGTFAPTQTLDEVECGDSLDGDGDGFVDCHDPDCGNSVLCGQGSTGTAAEKDCANGQDDDGDGFSDCADADCARAAPCVVPPPTGKFSGRVVVKGVASWPAPARVYVFDHDPLEDLLATPAPLAVVKANPDGTYETPSLVAGRDYFATAHLYQRDPNPVWGQSDAVALYGEGRSAQPVFVSPNAETTGVDFSFETSDAEIAGLVRVNDPCAEARGVVWIGLFSEVQGTEPTAFPVRWTAVGAEGGAYKLRNVPVGSDYAVFACLSWSGALACDVMSFYGRRSPVTMNVPDPTAVVPGIDIHIPNPPAVDLGGPTTLHEAILRIR